MQKKKYKTAKSFRKAIEDRLKAIRNEEYVPLERLRLHIAFDRFLCRLFKGYEGTVILKGGYSMELRIKTARATRDIDLAVGKSQNSSDEEDKNSIRAKLQKAVSLDLGDYFTFIVSEPRLDLEAIPYGGVRYAIDAFMDDRLFVRFPIDIVISSLTLDPIEMLSSRDWLSFAGIPQEPFPNISKEQQFAEKLHAYSFPRRGYDNSRVKDLVDLALLSKSGELNRDLLETAIQKIFEHRNTHPKPDHLKMPPESWEPVFSKLASECGLETPLIKELSRVALYLNLPIRSRVNE